MKSIIKKLKKGDDPLYFLLILLFALFILASFGYLVGFRWGVGGRFALPRPQQLTPGFQKAQEFANTYPGLLQRTFLSQEFKGTLVNFDPGKSWTIKKDGKTLTFTQTGQAKARYVRQKPKKTEEIDEKAIKIGDNVSINIIINPQTGQITVTSIILHPS